ncbi:hypothetical protein SEA_PUPPER_50 [Gordonia phage Pupper]|uniref:Uncharacterized protein n=1 Tax=Gordonia phage Pupper TaxID=2571249 RepID=A0A4Y6EIG9_9CAUD|nr:hypothetical protein KHQ83_gp227 [Gordonia phage Pupper]QDF18536.1 hypothetical protein SEA_PUPPER_50 [Gordonia phage Pupper]
MCAIFARLVGVVRRYFDGVLSPSHEEIEAMLSVDKDDRDAVA